MAKKNRKKRAAQQASAANRTTDRKVRKTDFILPMIIFVASMAFYWHQSSQNRFVSLDEIPAYTGEAVVELNGNRPSSFTEKDLIDQPFEEYGKLDQADRCTTASACVGPETMPTEAREDISSVTPTGWNQAYYDFIEDEALYNRCHLIGFQLTGENANERNLITGTRYMNVEGMLPFENMVADYVRETGNHVIYMVTPYFAELDAVARGVQIEAMSVEDKGEGICCNVFCHNVQPGVEINYVTGESSLAEEKAA